MAIREKDIQRIGKINNVNVLIEFIRKEYFENIDYYDCIHIKHLPDFWCYARGKGLDIDDFKEEE